MPIQHPGEILFNEYLDFFKDPNDPEYRTFAKLINYDPAKFWEVLSSKAPITVELAIKLETSLRVSAETWMLMQARYDIDKEKEQNGSNYKR